jgi:CheY-like chemotaxis protein
VARVLIVDDDVDTGEMLVDLLVAEGYTVEHVRNGQDALIRVQAHPPDVILLDLRMPVMDGLKFAAAYRALPGPHALIIATTAGTSLGKPGVARQFAAAIQKPFEVPALLNLLHQVLGR